MAKKFIIKWLIYIFCILLQKSVIINANLQEDNHVDEKGIVWVNKCCEKFEIRIDSECSQVNDTEYFQPMFTSYNGEPNMPVKFKFVIGLPACGSMQTWPIYHYQGSADKLILLDDGKLRHYTNTADDSFVFAPTYYGDEWAEESRPNFYDYSRNQYCIDRAISTSGDQRQVLFANICLAKKEMEWTDASTVVRKVFNPIFHVTSLIILLIIAIVYFIMPTLRDLVGNIVTTIAVCLMVAQIANLVRIFTEFTNHVSFLVADIILYVSILAAFFWLNSLGYYIWKSFRTRNVFLRVTDARRYCYYSIYAWSSTAFLGIMAVFSHFYLDAATYKKQNMIADQETIGWLGIAIFFAPVAGTIIVDIFFYVTTLKCINRRNIYGRIQHKLRSNFKMFYLMLLIMSISWLFLCLSWLNCEALLYVHIIVNGFQAPLLFYVCIMNPKHVPFLMRRFCCYDEPTSINDLGEEMHQMNCNTI